QGSPLPLLAACRARRDDPHAAWQTLEASFARGLWEEVERRRVRPLTADEQHRVIALTADLQRVRDQLVHLETLPEEQRDHDAVEALESRRAGLLTEAVELDAALSRRYDGSRPGALSIDRIAAALRPHSALVAWLDVSCGGPEPIERFGFILLPDGTARCVDLPGSGPAGTWTSDDQQLLDRFRAGLESVDAPVHSRGAGLVRIEPSDALARREEIDRDAARLRSLLIDPLRTILDGADVHDLVVVPSGPLAKIPLQALTDDFGLSYVPSGSLLASLRSRPRTRARGLLAVGAPELADDTPVDFRGAGLGPLPFGKREIESVATFLGIDERTVLIGQDATESRLLGLAQDGALSRYRYVHFATHAVIDEVDPMSSALLLTSTSAGDTLSTAGTGRPYDDGWLTAEEIRRGWRIDADLVTLSACRTGIGGGFGFISFADALLSAGARGLVLSRWKVDDRATALLMRRFYSNLGQRSLSPAAALRDAQHWLRGLDAKRVSELTAELTGGRARETSGTESPPFAHPYYWAAFVFVGG
ncbi:MAG: CHAT domain-containing protein, partial [Planctomycetes bacterium]|nr:CHAT domain-containing protein [Planctomycetota bacterium]